MTFATYNLTPRNISIDKSDLKKLINFATQKTTEAKELHRNRINLDGQTEGQKTEIHKALDEAYSVAVFVYGSENEEFIVHDSKIIDDPEFPEQLTRITIDSFIQFRNRTNLNPDNGMRIDLDVSSSKILDWQSNLSAPTPNASHISIQGIDDGWRASVLAFVQKLVRSRGNHRAFLHAAFTYDTYLWLLLAPIYFYTLIALEPNIDGILGGASIFIRVAIYVYSFFIFVSLYRILIGYIRWSFPSIELKGVQSTQQRHRRFWGFLVTAIIIPIIIALAFGH